MSNINQDVATAKKTWVSKSRLYTVNMIRDNYLTKPPGALGRRTGTLVRSVASEATESDDSFIVGTSVVYGVAWELGFTRPAYTVYATNAKALKIPTAGGFIFRKSAHIPSKSFLSRPFLQPGLDASYPYMIETAETEFGKVASNAFPDRQIVFQRG